MNISVAGTPIGGEDAREKSWKALVQAASAGCAPASSVALVFTLGPQRNVDLDNLSRPAMAALRDAGAFTYGFANLHRLHAQKQSGHPEGLLVEFDASERAVPGDVDIDCSFPELPPSDGNHGWKRAMTALVESCWRRPPVEGMIFADIIVADVHRRSLVELLKPILDVYQPYLGRSSSSNAFAPRDEQITWLQIQRKPCSSALSVVMGRLSS